MRQIIDQIFTTVTTAIFSACLVIVFFSFRDAVKEERQYNALLLLSERKSLDHYLNPAGYAIPNQFKFPPLISQMNGIIEDGRLKKKAVREIEEIKRQLIQLQDSVNRDYMTDCQEKRYKSLVRSVSTILDGEISKMLGVSVSHYALLQNLIQVDGIESCPFKF